MEEKRSFKDSGYSESHNATTVNSMRFSDGESTVSGNGSYFGSQKSQLPSTSFDDSPFINVKSNRIQRKKTQTKLTFLKKHSIGKKKATSVKTNVTEDRNEKETLDASSCKEPNSSDNTTESNNELPKSECVCPVCWKSFANKGEQMQHMKSCAAKHNLTLKQLLDAVDLHAKQSKERKVLGLPTVSISGIPKKSSSRKTSSANDKDDPDLQLGLALSVSMSECEEQKLLVEQEVMLEAGLSDEVAANQASLLERFGFTSSRPVLPALQPRTRPGKTKLKGTPVLLTRTQNDRERLITEKVAILLTNEDTSSPLSELHAIKYVLESAVLSQLLQKESLWKKANASPHPDDSNAYYVEPLSNVISPSKTKTGSKLKHLSQVPCRLKSPNKDLPGQNLLDKTIDQNVKISDHTFSSKEENESQIKTSVDTNSNHGTNHMDSKLAEDWRKLFIEGKNSDIKILVCDNGEINVHELVLFARCPRILDDIKEVNDTRSVRCIMWCDVSFKAAFAFLEYIYSGSSNKIDESKDCIDEILGLSTKYCVDELVSHLQYVADLPRMMPFVSCPEATSLVTSQIERQKKHELTNVQEISLLSDIVSSQQLMAEEISARNIRCYTGKDYNDYANGVKDICSPSKPELRSSPDPFNDTFSPKILDGSCSSTKDLQDTQRNISELLMALSDNEKESDSEELMNDVPKFHYENSVSPASSPHQPILAKSSSICTQNEACETTTRKRKLAYSNDLSCSKVVCKDDRRTARKSLLHDFDLEQVSESVVSKLQSSPSAHDSPSRPILELVGRNLNGDCFIEASKEMSSDDVEIVDEFQIGDCGGVAGKQPVTGSSSPSSLLSCCSTLKLGRESDEKSFSSVNSCISNKAKNDQESVNSEGSCDVLGDLCADFEYQHFCATYSPSKDVVSTSFQAKRSSSISPSMKTASPEIISPFSSPKSVKSSSKGSSPHKKNGEKTLRRAASCSNVSRASLQSSPSPVALRCFSQTSIHLKSPVSTYQEQIEVHSSDDCQDDTAKPNSSFIRPSQLPKLSSPQKTPRRSSLNYLKHLLEDSFCTELQHHFEDRSLSNGTGGLHCSTPIGSPANATERNENITPLADYSAMSSPMLKKELQKFGLKQMKPNKAKKILRHIYHELHPLVPLQSSDGKSKCGNASEDEQSFNSSQGSSSSSRSEFEVPEDHDGGCVLTQKDLTELPAVVRNYITSNPEMHQKVLLYEPISLEQLRDSLKTQNHKFKLNDLMEYLDQECITFRTSQWHRTQKRRKKVENKE